MKIGIVEFNGELAKLFQSEISPKVQPASFEVKKALDLFDVLAYARKLVSLDQLVIIAQLDDEQKDLNRVFYEGLATLEGETGKNIFKCIYSDSDDGEAMVKELAETFFNYLFHPERLGKKEKPEESGFGF